MNQAEKLSPFGHQLLDKRKFLGSTAGMTMGALGLSSFLLQTIQLNLVENHPSDRVLTLTAHMHRGVPIFKCLRKGFL